ncbi:MAG: transcription termination/antitermination protein NusA [Anaerolineales bacterium]|nr:transcription termination/antitermination protein NusA [Anaerolineales bacterium]
MKSEFALAFNEITERFGLSPETVMHALEAAMVSAYRRSVNASNAQSVEVKITLENGEVEVFAEKEVVEGVENPLTEVELERAREFDPEAELGGMVMVESTPEDFGRVAAQTAKQVILQRLREAERDAQYDEFIEREGDMVHGTVHSITPQAVTVGLGRAEAILPRNQQIPGERFRVRDRIRIYVLEVRKSPRGPVIVVSRTHPSMLRRLLEMEVPEINQGLVEIKAIAREAGKRAKVAVSALRDGVDPVGACVGLRGVRIQSIVRDLNDEKIDVIEWNPDPATFISKALSPARVNGVYLDEDPSRGKTAMVVVPEDQLSLAIGRAGVNARLAARLTSWRIDIKDLIEATNESLVLITTGSEFIDLADKEGDVLERVEAIMAKKAENRPATPEEYLILTSFVDRIQSEVMRRRSAGLEERRRLAAVVESTILPEAYEVELEALDLNTRTINILAESGYTNAGQILAKYITNSDALLGLQGIGPKAIEEIEEKLAIYRREEPVVVVPEVEEALDVEAEEPAVDAEAELAAAEGVGEPLEPTEVAEEQAEPVLAAGLTLEAGVLEPILDEQVVVDETPIDFAKQVEELELDFTDVIETKELDEPEEDEEADKRKRRTKSRVMEYDPDRGEMIVTRRRKRGEVDPEDIDWEF